MLRMLKSIGRMNVLSLKFEEVKEIGVSFAVVSQTTKVTTSV